MIRSFKCPETQRIFNDQISLVFPPDIQRTARRRLRFLDAATSLRDLASQPGNRLEALKGNRRRRWSIRINNQWRICFRWENGAEDVEIVDYH